MMGGLTLEEALRIAYSEQENDITDIFITPPESHVLTDEDSGDETKLIPDNFTGRQLRSEAEIRCRIGMLHNLPNKLLPYKFYLDNLFTGIPLYNFLRQNGYSATGTVRDNKVPKECPLKTKAQMKKQPRGTIDSCIARDLGIIFVKWVDNNVVTVASTSYGVEPLSNVKRYSQSEKKIIQVPRPNLIGLYNNFMGGTDQMDGNLGRYRISIRSKK
ncbi:hypothetical protein NQ314_006141 [Rhamnusium bicolor]|uniref:PiggyBac transposable element-derived protein domain-containing protein n=1 Tax=Rhamnusium bicolor TaxID=1586634 RepID=A0AAV8Z791_9CUCU|nr:hypothetical protein NQ314_006141 [Rhamnusium bicolor]